MAGLISSVLSVLLAVGIYYLTIKGLRLISQNDQIVDSAAKTVLYA